MPYTRYVRKPKRKVRRTRQTRRRATELLTGTFANSPLAQSVAGQAVKYGAKYGAKAVSAGAKAIRRRFTRPRRFINIDNRIASSGQSDIMTPIVSKIKISRAKPIETRVLKTVYLNRKLRLQRIRPLNEGGTTPPGSLWFEHSTVNTNWTATPCYLMCLNSTLNNVASSRAVLNQLCFNDSGGIELIGINNQDPSGTFSQTNWNIDYENNGPNRTVAHRYIMQDHYDIRLNCYGANNQPTVYDIMIISFVDQHLDPFESPSNTQEAADRHKTWQSLVQPYMVNPIMPVAYVKKKYIVHKRIRFTLQPTLNVENDTTPQSRIVKMFVKDGSIYDYAYHGDGFAGAGADDRISTVQYVTQNLANSDYSEYPSSRARKYLVVRALNTTRNTIDANRTNTPSFDIIVRKNEYISV